ncbi:ABC transporter ATP-binding protein [Kribbella solani]|uniref:ABC transporter ATP-binding protein n=1 Tax=Kribbella solani TaxID=236067 RepID=UPI0029A8810D|nr:ABC transporter ATP-binding protein [Kribbella solani]MDX2974179.1 ABC transporter ATP-binding protein [Kribbella solani]MDX3006249.1 ABC transporter ATP-binding protein [Kribbella solani]
MTEELTETERRPVLAARRVTKHFQVRGRRTVRALEDATVELHGGSIVALVGESGSGKTTLARVLARYYPPTDGTIELDGRTIDERDSSIRRYYGRVQLLFQDPFASLNPLHSIRHILGRPLRIHQRAKGRAEAEQAILALLRRVNLTPAEDYIDKYPHELSGGQRQRIVIARALAVGPRVMLGDEPISMLDVSIRLDILNLLKQLRDDGLALLYITHDIASARYVADEIKVMYAGQMIESGPTEQVIQHPAHPYTRLLLASSPNPEAAQDQGRPRRYAGAGDLGEPPSLIDPPAGCRFNPRCPYAMRICRTTEPPVTELGRGHWTRCHLDRTELLRPTSDLDGEGARS